MKTAVEWYSQKYLGLLVKLENKEISLGEYVTKHGLLLEEAKEMEKQQLLNMSLMSAHYERKWILEHSTESQYNPSKVEIRDLEKTALEHYNETFKQQEQ